METPEKNGGQESSTMLVGVDVQPNGCQPGPSDNLEVECKCWQKTNDPTDNAFDEPCSSKHCVYAYIKSGHQSFEQFKIQILNVKKFVTVKVMKNLLRSLGLDTSKIKPIKEGVFFVTFRSAEDRQKAIQKLDGYIFKGRPLEAKVCKPATDPVLLKRARGGLTWDSEGDPHCSPSPISKKPRQHSDGENAETVDPILNVAPLYQMIYDPDQLRSKQRGALQCLSKMQKAIKRVNNLKYCDQCLDSGFMSPIRKLDYDCCPISPSPIVNGYRNKSKFTIGKHVTGKCPVIGVRLGKYTDGSTEVAYPSAVPIFSHSTLAAVESLQMFFDAISHPDSEDLETGIVDKTRLLQLSNRLRVYDLILKSGNWCAVVVRESRLGDRLLEIELQRGDLTDEELADLEIVLKQWFEPGGPGAPAGVTALHLTILTGVSQLPGTFIERCVFGKETIKELCCGLSFKISKDAFFQVNTLATEKLYEYVKARCRAILEKEGKSAEEAILLDICCGTGTIGLCLADSFHKVYGVDSVASAVENANENAKENGITNAHFYVGKAEVFLKDFLGQLPDDKAVIAVLDPPRAGVHNKVVEAIRRCEQIRHLIFVACDLERAVSNFESFARPPSKRYIGSPFLPTGVSCVDLFPHTPGAEVVVSLKRLPFTQCVHDVK